MYLQNAGTMIGTGSVCLCMIVKNEERVLARALESAAPAIQRWCIVDTGSTDLTQSVIRTVLDPVVPGTLHSRPWVDFGTNRTEALALAVAEGTDWILMFDADDNLDWGADGAAFSAPLLAEAAAAGVDSIRLTVAHGNITHVRPHLFRTASAWQYVLPVHEYPVARAPASGRHIHLATPRLIARTEGARSADPKKYIKDAAALEAFRSSPALNPFDRSRCLFYLAQSYHNAGKHDETALELYDARSVDTNGYTEEAYVSCVRGIEILQGIAARATSAAARTAAAEQALVLAVRAGRLNGARAEAAAALMVLMRTTQKPAHRTLASAAALAVAIAVYQKVGKTPPAGSLFATADTYAWKLADEIAIACYWEGRNPAREAIGLAAATAAIAGFDATGGSPGPARDRLTANLSFLEKMSAGAEV